MYVVYVDFDPGGRGMTQRGGRASSPPPPRFLLRCPFDASLSLGFRRGDGPSAEPGGGGQPPETDSNPGGLFSVSCAIIIYVLAS